MILSRGRRYIFIHIPKTGGTALTLALEGRAMKDDNASARSGDGDANRTKLLIVDDQVDIAEMIGEVASGLGFDPHPVAGRQALAPPGLGIERDIVVPPPRKHKAAVVRYRKQDWQKGLISVMSWVWDNIDWVWANVERASQGQEILRVLR